MEDHSLLARLNPFQKEVVLHNDIRPLLVLAAAGVGKTTALTTRIAYMVREHGVAPERILAVTFTHKSAKEMRDRVGTLLTPVGADAPPATLPEVSTFHSVCAKILRAHATKLGLRPDFKILDQKDSLAMMSTCLEKVSSAHRHDDFAKLLTSIRWQLDMWRNLAKEPDDAAREVAEKQRRFVPGAKYNSSDAAGGYAARLYPAYMEMCRQTNVVDMPDLIMHVVRLFRHHPDVLKECRERWSHVLVDEFQDTNPVQFEFVRRIVTPEHHLMVVGDADQSIHEWRGACLRNILNFEETFVNPRIIKLENNYRSTQTILDAANALIKNNTFRRENSMVCTKERGELIGFSEHPDEWDEAVSVAAKIKAVLAAGTCRPGDIAVLYRVNASSKNMENALRSLNIPFKVRGGTSFWERAEIKDVLAYMHLVCAEDDDAPASDVLDRAFVRILNQPARGIGATTSKRLQDAAAAKDKTIVEVARDIVDNPANSKVRARKVLAAFLAVLDDIREKLVAAEAADAAALCMELLEKVGYMALLKKDVDISALARERMDNVSALIAELQRSGRGLSHFLMDSSLLFGEEPEDASMTKVQLLTMHAVKGLEYKHVFLLGCSEGSLPHYFSIDSPAKIEEERRLMYVAITRAMESLHLSRSKTRASFTRTFSSKASRFLKEIPASLMVNRL